MLRMRKGAIAGMRQGNEVSRVEWLQYDFMQRALAAGLITAVICPLIGVFVVVRRQALIGDGLGHISFAGITAAYLAGVSPVVGAFVFTLAGAVGIELVRRRHKQYTDMGLAIFFYAGAAAAIILSTMTRMPSAGLLSVLFGSLMTVTTENVMLIAASAVFAAGVLLVYYKKLLLVAFNEDIAAASGINTRYITMMFSVLTALVVVVGMTVVGILMVSALMIIPVASAHALHKGFRTTMLAAVGVSVLSVVSGLLLSYYWDAAPGGTIVMAAICIYMTIAGVRQLGNWSKQ